MKSYEAIMKELEEAKADNASLRRQLAAAMNEVENLQTLLGADESCEGGCDCEYECGCCCENRENYDVLGDAMADLSFKVEEVKAAVLDGAAVAVDKAKAVGTKIATSKFTKNLLTGCQNALKKASDGIEKLGKDKKD